MNDLRTPYSWDDQVYLSRVSLTAELGERRARERKEEKKGENTVVEMRPT